jgi:hypothetical protein
MKKLDWVALICGLLLSAVNPGSAQPAFQNLDFESANVPIVPIDRLGESASFSNAFPGWTGYFGDSPATYANHNNYTLGSYGISILGPNWIYEGTHPIFEGNYSAILQSGFTPPFGGGGASAVIAQTGLIPDIVQSVQMKIRISQSCCAPVLVPPLDQLGVTVSGVNIVMVPLQVTPTYTLYGGDISLFAGQVQELQIAALPRPQAVEVSLLLDSIEFSPEAIPEPRSLSLITGAFFLAIHIAKRRRLKASRV